MSAMSLLSLDHALGQQAFLGSCALLSAAACHVDAAVVVVGERR
jgi:hypothetical protein